MLVHTLLFQPTRKFSIETGEPSSPTSKTLKGKRKAPSDRKENGNSASKQYKVAYVNESEKEASTLLDDINLPGMDKVVSTAIM